VLTFCTIMGEYFEQFEERVPVFCKMCGLTVSWKGLLYGVWTYLGRALFLQCVDLPKKIILYSMVLTIYRVYGPTYEGYFVQCVDLSGRAFCTVYGPI
jgi:hypothetical protein